MHDAATLEERYAAYLKQSELGKELMTGTISIPGAKFDASKDGWMPANLDAFAAWEESEKQRAAGGESRETSVEQSSDTAKTDSLDTPTGQYVQRGNERVLDAIDKSAQDVRNALSPLYEEQCGLMYSAPMLAERFAAYLLQAEIGKKMGIATVVIPEEKLPGGGRGVTLSSFEQWENVQRARDVGKKTTSRIEKNPRAAQKPKTPPEEPKKGFWKRLFGG